MNRLRSNKVYRLLAARNGYLIAGVIFAIYVIVQLAINTPRELVSIGGAIYRFFAATVPPVFFEHPFLTLFAVFLFYVASLVTVAYYDSKQNRDIDISIVPGTNGGWWALRYTNNIGSLLQGCFVMMNWANNRATGEPEITGRHVLKWQGSRTRSDLDNGRDDLIIFVNTHTPFVMTGEDPQPNGGQILTADGNFGLTQGLFDIEIEFGGLSVDNASIQKKAWLYVAVTADSVEVQGIGL